MRASSARVRNSAFSARWAKPALAPHALKSPTLVPHLNLHRAGGWDPQFRRICKNFKNFSFKNSKSYRRLKTGLAKAVLPLFPMSFSLKSGTPNTPRNQTPSLNCGNAQKFVKVISKLIFKRYIDKNFRKNFC